MGFLSGKRALIVGVASNRSIAWGIAKAMHREGAELAFSYLNDKLKKRVDRIAEECGTDIVLPCDVSSDQEIEGMFDALKGAWPDGVDIIVHSVGFAPADQLQGSYVDAVTREGFQIAHDISAYSFAALAKGARGQLRSGGALLTLSYLGAERAMPNYNVMGVAKAALEANVRYLAQSLGPQNVRVNAISAGPIRTLAASGIGNFRKMLDHVERCAPLRRTINTDEVGNVAAFLCSDLASGVTGEITYVDAGYNIQGMAELVADDPV